MGEITNDKKNHNKLERGDNQGKDNIKLEKGDNHEKTLNYVQTPATSVI